MARQNVVRQVEIQAGGRTFRIEYRLIAPRSPQRPLLVFLHEGLGSLAMWKRFPERLCAAAGLRGLVYSRPGYGRSTPRPSDERWDLDFMHRQAHELLPALFAALGVGGDVPPWLFGHSDGGSIALLYAARFPERVQGVIAVAPHLFVEPMSIASIEAARDAYLNGDLRRKLARYHDDVESAFWGWNEAWLRPPFRDWNIEAEIATIRCPLLAVQGCDDEYGTLEQLRAIARRLPQARLVELAACGHSPQRDQPARLIEEVARFIEQSDREVASSKPTARPSEGGSA